MAEDETAPDDPAANARSPAPPPQDRGTFLPLVFGGAVAVALGFFGAQLEGVERALGLAPEDNPLQQTVDQQAETIAAQAERIDAQAGQIAELQEQIANLPEPPEPVDLSGVEGRLDDTGTRLQSTQADLAALSERLAELEKRPMTESLSEEAIAAYEAELQRLQESVNAELSAMQETAEQQRAELESILAEARTSETAAAEQAKVAQARAAMSRIMSAVSSGTAFTDAVAEIRAADGVEVPAALAETAEEGVPTLAELQTSFPAEARDALAVSRDADTAGGEGGIGSFLQRQLGARSVTPREGDSADAVLSRAEAALREGEVDRALEELQALPDAAREAMSDWIAAAETRSSATRAAQDLMTTINAN